MYAVPHFRTRHIFPCLLTRQNSGHGERVRGIKVSRKNASFDEAVRSQRSDKLLSSADLVRCTSRRLQWRRGLYRQVCNFAASIPTNTKSNIDTLPEIHCSQLLITTRMKRLSESTTRTSPISRWWFSHTYHIIYWFSLSLSLSPSWTFDSPWSDDMNSMIL